MSLHELRAGLGLLLALALIIGGSLGIGLPLAALIIWLFSQPPVRSIMEPSSPICCKPPMSH